MKRRNCCVRAKSFRESKDFSKNYLGSKFLHELVLTHCDCRSNCTERIVLSRNANYTETEYYHKFFTRVRK